MKWQRVCDALERISASPSIALRRTLLRSLLDDARAGGDPYSVMRILLPKRDRLRPQYQLKETFLAACLVDALALAPGSKDGSRLLSWRTSAGSVSGDLSLLACEVIRARQQQQRGELSVTDIHCHLDKLSSSSTREGKLSVLRDLIKQTTAQQMKWIVRVILQEMRMGVGEKMILNAFHPGANSLMSFCVDLHQVCVKLASPSASSCQQDLVVGKAMKCQHSKRVTSIDEAWELMIDKRMVAECKFDGDRMQLHKDGDNLHFWSRNGLEHAEYNAAIGSILKQNIASQRCVLDGELLVWDCSEEKYKPRTHNLNRDAARAARKGWDNDELVCYVVFDILYEEEHGSLLNLSLNDRHALLKKSVKQCHPRLITILPDGDSKWSIKPNSREDLHQFFDEVVQRGDEGIVVKDLGSQWCPDNRDGRWCKIKPDYLNLGSDLDLLIIGGYYGRGQHGGQIVSYLLAVKDQSKTDDTPPKFLSICRCGGGLSRAEQKFLQQKLAPHFVKNTQVPENSGYMVTNSRFERPDVWISSPKLSVVLQVSAEKRVYASYTFKAGWTFRFPRADKIRHDKNWQDCLSIQELHEMVASARAHGSSLIEKYEAPDKRKQKKRKSHAGNLVPVFLQGCDVSHIERQSSQFLKLVFYICKSGQNEMTQDLDAQIKKAGGTTVLNLEACVTHVIAAQPRGLCYRAAVTSGRDVICMAWLQECLNSTKLLPIIFRHYLHMSNATKEKLKDEVDSFGDPYADSITPEDLHQIFQRMEDIDEQNTLTDTILKVEARFAGPWQCGIFRRMTLYLLPPIHSTNVDSQIVAQFALQRLSLEVSMYGAAVVKTLNNAVTHVIVFAPSDVELPFKSILRSIPTSDQREILLSENVNVVSHLWLQDIVQRKGVPPLAAYNLRTEIVVDDSTATVRASCTTTKEEMTVRYPKRHRVCQMPTSAAPCSIISDAPKEESHSDAKQHIAEDFLRLLLPNYLW